MLVARIIAGVIGALALIKALPLLAALYFRWDPIALSIGGVLLLVGLFVFWFALFGNDAGERVSADFWRGLLSASSRSSPDSSGRSSCARTPTRVHCSAFSSLAPRALCLAASEDLCGRAWRGGEAKPALQPLFPSTP